MPGGPLTSAERRLRVALRAMGGILIGAALVYALGGVVKSDTFRELPFVANSTVKVTVLGLACLYAAGNVRLRRGLVAIVIGAHLVSVSAMGVMLAFGDTDRMVDVFGGVEVGTLLWGAIALDGAITAVIAVLWLMARPPKTAEAEPAAPRESLTKPERTLRILAIAAAVFYILGGIAYLVGPLLSSTDRLFVELPYVTNSTVKVATLAMLALYAARDLRRNAPLLGVVVFAHFLSILVQFGYLFLDAADRRLPVGDGTVAVKDMLWVGIAHEGVIGIVLLWAYVRALSARYDLQFLRPMEYRAFEAAADVFVAGRHEQVTGADVASNMEHYFRRMRAHRRWAYRVALFATELRPLLVLWPPMSQIEPGERREYLRRLFEHPRLPPAFVKNTTRGFVRLIQQISYAGYYGDPRTFDSIGYKPFTQRDRVKQIDVPQPGPHPLSVMGPTDAETEVCIVGSGAAGSVLAYELAKRGHDVLILEKGEYVEPRAFSEDEIEMIGRLYADGVMQQTRDYRFTVLQGSCVGGSTTVNNAVSFRPPRPVVEHWNNGPSDSRVDIDRLYESAGAIEEMLGIKTQDGIQLNPSGHLLVDGAKELGLVPDQLEVGVVRANIDGCFGSGYCNIGCRWGKKLSMLETVLPRAQREYPGRVRIMADAEVTRIRQLSGDTQHVIDLRGSSRAGLKFTIKAKAFVLSAGAVASSWAMLRSGVGRGLPVGEQLCFNMGSPMTAEFDHELRSYDGLQISHYGLPRDNGYAFETWFNPPVSQAVNMPGWFEQHFDNMSAFNRLMAVGVLVGTEGNAHVARAVTGGPDVIYTPTTGDLEKMAKGMRQLAEILFAAGATRVMLNTWGYDEFKRGADLDRLVEVIRRPNYLTLGTGHPQGGNAISHSPEHGVVDPGFRVHGYDNLFVCDASVFPSSLTVNPQLTTMSVAHYAAGPISERIKAAASASVAAVA
jgi:choline dehydrogenase-like flavoprotein